MPSVSKTKAISSAWRAPRPGEGQATRTWRCPRWRSRGRRQPEGGLSPVGAAAILAETGDLHRFTSARAVVKHAGLAPRERMSGTFTGRARLTGAGRPRLRVAAWRAVWGCLQTNRVYAARYRHLTTRETNKLTPTQAQTVVAAAILRQLYAVVATGRRGTRSSPPTAPGRNRGGHCGITRCAPSAGRGDASPELGRGEPSAALRTLAVSRRSSQAAPSRRRHNPITRCRARARLPLCRDRRPDTGTRPALDAKHLTLMVGRRRLRFCWAQVTGW